MYNDLSMQILNQYENDLTRAKNPAKYIYISQLFSFSKAYVLIAV